MGVADKASHKAEDLKGKIKKGTGKVTGNKRLEAEGQSDQAKSAVKDAGEKIKDAAAKVKHALTGH
jgi:uncharacterized protein YjbJ (UPF0337 family)